MKLVSGEEAVVEGGIQVYFSFPVIVVVVVVI